MKKVRKISELDQAIINEAMKGGRTYRAIEQATGASFHTVRRCLSKFPHVRARVVRHAWKSAPVAQKAATGTLELF